MLSNVTCAIYYTEERGLGREVEIVISVYDIKQPIDDLVHSMNHSRTTLVSNNHSAEPRNADTNIVCYKSIYTSQQTCLLAFLLHFLLQTHILYIYFGL